jgi:hypothetical protein
VIDTAIKFLSDEVNTYLKKRALNGQNFGSVIAGQIVDDNGKWAVAADNVGLTLINIEEERLLQTQLPERVYINGNHIVMPPELKLNLTVLFHIRYTNGNYEQSLRFLSSVLTFFQAHPSFTADAYPGLDPNIEKLTVEMLSLSTEQLNQIWAYLGSKYLPSVAYRVRMIVLQDAEALGIAKPITTVTAVLHDK